MLRKSKSILLITALLVLTLVSPALTFAASSDNGNQADPLKGGIQAYVDAMQPGWNLGNTFDSTGSDETSWGNPRVTKQLIQEIARQGFHSIRIPVTWQQHMGTAPEYTIDASYLARVAEVVQWSLDEGLYVMINMHHDSWQWVLNMGSQHDEVLARYNAAWTQIAAKFKDYSTKLSFESINEPRFSGDWGASGEAFFESLDELNTSFHQIVRVSGGNNASRPLVLPTLETNAGQDRLDQLYKSFQQLNDPNLIATVHYYGFWPFSVNIAGFTRFDETTKKDITDTFDRVYTTLVAKGIPVILGEYGLLGFDKNTGTIEQGEKLKFFEFLLHYLNQTKITHMLWDNGQHFNRTTYKWNDPQLFNLIETSWKTRSAVADSDLIYIKQGQTVQDAVINLQLNGNRLIHLYAGGEKLQNGKDYDLSDSKLTIKASLLAKLTEGEALGQQAVLTAIFNKGADWTFDVIKYSTPTVSNATGTVEDFSIPTSFNGDRLATMEAVYKTDGNAGPQNWTSYKEFAYAFTPSYDTNEVKLLNNFFKEVQDGEVNLKLHFWSGEVVNYTITKNGASVVGSAS